MEKHQEQPPPYEPSAPQGYPPTGPTYTYQQSGYPPQPQGYTPYPEPVTKSPGQEGYGQPAGYPQGYGVQQPGAYGYPQGYGMQQQSSSVVVTNQPNTVVIARPRPTNWLIPAIFACLCFWPIGICAIVAANNANRAADSGDYIESENQARKARNFVIASFVAGIVIYVLIIVLRVVLYSSYYSY